MWQTSGVFRKPSGRWQDSNEIRMAEADGQNPWNRKAARKYRPGAEGWPWGLAETAIVWDGTKVIRERLRAGRNTGLCHGLRRSGNPQEKGSKR